MRRSFTAPPFARHMISDLTDMDRDPRPVEAGEIVEHELPDDAYFEYAYKDEDGNIRLDPDNELTAKSVWYGDVSYVTGPEYQPDELADPPDDLGTGKTERLRLTSEVMDGDTRRATVYSPSHVSADEPTPLAIVQDGVAFNRIGKLHLVAEALARRDEIAPLRFVFVEPVDRMVEYAFDEQYMRFVEEELAPEVEAQFPLTDERIWIGASLGALASVTLALRRAERTGAPEKDAVVAMSGAFLGSPGSYDAYRSTDSWLLDTLRSRPAALPRRWYLEVGTLEWLHDVNRDVASELRKRNDVESEYRERSAGHNWPNWKNGLPSALRFIAPPG